MFFGLLRPTSLVLSALSLLVASSPLPVDSKATPELRQLTGENFKTSVAQNDWYVGPLWLNMATMPLHMLSHNADA
jgi:hypothetical protein